MHSGRINLRATPAEIAALDSPAGEWNAMRSQIIRSMIVGTAMAQLDDDADALESQASLEAPLPSVDDVLPDLPSIDDVFAPP